MSSVRRIGRNTGVQVAGELFGKVGSLAFYAVMARTLGQSGFGDFSFALSLAFLLTVFAGFGTDAVLTREASRDSAVLGELFWNAIAIKAALGALGIAIAVAISVIGDYDLEVQLSVLILGVAAVIELISKTAYATFQAHDDMRPVATAFVYQRSSTALVGITVMLLGAGVVVVSFTYLVGVLVAQYYAYAVLRRRGIRPGVSISLASAKALAVGAAPLGVAVIFNAIVFRVDATILSLMKGNAAVGLYSSAYRLLESTLFISYAFVAAVLPTLSRLGRKTSPTIAHAYALGLKGIVAVLLPVGAVFVLFAEPVIGLVYGDDFLPAISAMRLLGAAAALYGVSYLGSYVLVSQNRTRVIPVVAAAVAALNIVLNLALIPRYSFDGAALATSISEASLALGFTALAIGTSGRIAVGRIVAGPVLGCIAMLAVWLVLGDAIIWMVLSLIAYAAIVACFEWAVFREDFDRIAAAVRVRRRPAGAESR